MRISEILWVLVILVIGAVGLSMLNFSFSISGLSFGISVGGSIFGLLLVGFAVWLLMKRV